MAQGILKSLIADQAELLVFRKEREEARRAEEALVPLLVAGMPQSDPRPVCYTTGYWKGEEDEEGESCVILALSDGTYLPVRGVILNNDDTPQLSSFVGVALSVLSYVGDDVEQFVQRANAELARMKGSDEVKSS